MEQFVPFIGMALVGLGVVGLLVWVGRVAVWYRRHAGKIGPASKSERRS